MEKKINIEKELKCFMESDEYLNARESGWMSIAKYFYNLGVDNAKNIIIEEMNELHPDYHEINRDAVRMVMLDEMENQIEKLKIKE